MSSDQPPQPFSLRNVTTYQAGVVQAAMHREIQKESDECLKQFGITKMHWIVIGTILDAGAEGIRITDLAEILQTGLPYLTTTINLLETNGMLTRSTHGKDARAKVVIVSPEFVGKCHEIETALRQRLRESIYSRVTPEEFAIYMKVLFNLSRPSEPSPVQGS